MELDLLIGRKKVLTIVDTGSPKPLIDKKLVKQLKLTNKKNTNELRIRGLER